MPNTRRIEKVSSLLKKEITFILMNDLDNNLILDNFVSITKIELTKDLQHCKIYVNSSAENNLKNQILEALNLSKNQIKFILSKRIEIKRIPELCFKIDKVFDQGLSVLKILDQLREEKPPQLFEQKNEQQ